MNKPVFILLISILTFSCQNPQKKTIEKEKVNLNGNWEYLGYGKAITIGDTIIKSYHTSKIGNIHTADNTAADFFNYYTIDTLSNDTIRLKDGEKSFKLFRSTKDFAHNLNEELKDDPIYNFEVLWNTFNEHYVYFKERNIDWNKLYETYRPQINEKTKPIELYLVFEDMLAEIKDSHISIDLPEELEEEYNQTKKGSKSEKQESDNGPLQKEIRTTIIEQHIKNPRRFNKGVVTYGKINDDIGYMLIQNMVTMAHYTIPDSLSTDKFWDKWWTNLNSAKNYHDDVQKGTRFIMDSIIRDLGNLNALVIDLRFNGGGFDDASIEILNHLVNKETDFSTKKVKLGDGFTQKQINTLFPSEYNFKGKVYALTSAETASASEVLVLGIKTLPNSEIIGSTTEGVFSDILSKKLPNGWTYGLSNMIYETMDGVSYENIGIEPDHQLNYPKKSDEFYNYLYQDIKDGDEAIKKVIELETEK